MVKTIEQKILEFDDNLLLSELLGANDNYINYIEKSFGITIICKGNLIVIKGDKSNVKLAEKLLKLNYGKLEKGVSINLSDIESSIAMAKSESKSNLSIFSSEISIKTEKLNIHPKSAAQSEYIKLLQTKDMVFSNGPAGTGKTYMAVAVAVSMLISHKVDKIILTRPAIEAGEKIGFLPGDMKEKVDPFMQPIYDALNDMLFADRLKKYIENKVIEIAPLAFMRGRTLKDAFIILDEAQNTTSTQMKMFLTRLGENSKMVINGDLSQVDLPRGITSGLSEATDKLSKINEIGFIKFDETQIVRHSLVRKIVKAYNNYN